MKIYTKILIGMAAGAVIGLTLGPQSPLLEKDLYKVFDPTALTFHVSAPAGLLVVKLPKVPLRLRATATPDGRRVQVALPWTRELAIRDTSGKLKRALGSPTIGDAVPVIMTLAEEPVDGGGTILHPQPVSHLGDQVIGFLAPFGTLFMRLIKMVIVPLVFASLLVGVASLGDIRKLGRLGGKTLGLYFGTTAIAVSIGLFLAHLFNPGGVMSAGAKAALQAQYTSAAGSKVEAAARAPSAMDNILSIIPDNPLGALAEGNMLQVIFFATILGIALTLMDKSKASLVVRFFDGIQEAMVVVIHIVMAIAPIGVLALIAEVVGNSGVDILAALLWYGVTVVVGLLLHATLVYGSLARFLAKLPLADFLRGIRPAQLIAFSTSSSSATLPVSMECAEENLGVSKSTASFVLPLGATVNMDGTALYQGVAAIFIAQVFQMDLSFGDQLGIVLTATMASVGAAGVPGAGIVTLAMVLTQAGIPAVGVALILGMDRLLDMFRTVINVTGDLAVTASMARLEGEDLRVLTDREDAGDHRQGFEGRLQGEEHPVDPEQSP